jgi:hypothetical protein
MRRFRLTPLLAGLAILASVSLCSAQATTPVATTTSTTPTTNGGRSTPESPATSGDPKKATEDSNKVEAAVSAASPLVADADKYQKTINAITMPAAKSTQPSLDNLQQLQTTVEAISRSKLIDNLINKKADITSNESARSRDCNLSQPSTGAQQDVTDALAKCTEAGRDAKEKSAAIDTALSGLQTSLGTISPYVGDQVTALQNKLKPFSKLTGGNSDVSTILGILPTNLPVLKQVLESKDQYQNTWNSMEALLSQLKVTAGAKDAAGNDATVPDKAFTGEKGLQKTVDGIVSNLDAWFKTISDKMQGSAKSLDGMISDVLSDPAKYSANALGTVRTLSDDIASAQSVVDAWAPLVGFLVDGQPDSFNLKTTRTDWEGLHTWVNVAQGSISRVHDALAGDAEKFETDQVSLYYFTDVNRLMHALNESVQTLGGVAEAQANAAAQRTALTQAELELTDAQATVNRFQKEVLDLQEQQRQAQAKVKGLNSNVSKLGNRLNNSQDAKNQADAEYQQAKSDQAAAPTDPTKTTALNKAAAKQTSAATKLSQSQSDYDAAKAEQDKAQSQVDDSQNQSDSLPGKMAAAQQALIEAQTAVSKRRRDTLMAAQAESDAFAFARDNTPYLYAPAVASSRDPAKRVILYAFNDSKTIFMRGTHADLAQVKRIIQKFDQPAPQARLTLWTLELSAEKASRGTINHLNQAMEIIDGELSTTRARVNTTLALLREEINAQVQQAESDIHDPPPSPLTSLADQEKWLRIHFYAPEVLDQLGFVPSNPDLDKLKHLVPDPSATTTLGEALMILSLARPNIRLTILGNFETHFATRLSQAAPALKSEASNVEEQCAAPKASGANLVLTWQAVSAFPGPATAAVNFITSAQLEIAHALRAAYDKNQLDHGAENIGRWYDEVTNIDRQRTLLGQAKVMLVSEDAKKLSPADQLKLADLQQQVARHDAQFQRLSALSGTSLADPTALSALQKELDDLDSLNKAALATHLDDRNAFQRYTNEINGLDIQRKNIGLYAIAFIPEFAQQQQIPLPSPPNQGNFAEILQRIQEKLQSTPPEASARAAAADQMLKELIIAVEDDLDRLFIQPMICRLRVRLLTQPDVRVGILQRESLLATNRGVARIDPRASAQLAVGDQQDILGGVQQLAQIYAAAQTGGALGALKVLQQQPREPQPEIYALTTGNKFQVTPIFDPTGQALRFKFDFVGSSNLQEPNGTTNPTFPRIERHTVNTEVQLSNLETREISRFEANAKLGLPTQYWGGFPIFKDIPGFRPWVPLIGWFVRKGGSNASVQQSVIFGQTTMYPTISRIVDLLSQKDNN